MIKNKKSESRPRRALFILLSGLLAILLVLGLAQFAVAGDGEPAQPIPDNGSWERDDILTDAEAAQINSRLEQYIALEFISPDQLLGSDFSTSTKDVDRAEVPAGSELQYAIVISNTGDTNAAVTMVDALPAGLSYVSHERVGGSGYFPYDPEFIIGVNEVTWNGEISGGGYVEIAIKAGIDESVPAGTMLTNAAQISDDGETVSPTVKITVLEKVDVLNINLPMISFHQPDPPDVNNLSATRPNSKNQFTLSWTGGPNATRYEVQQAHDPNFSSPVSYNTGLNTVLALQPAPSWRNDYYFRVRSYDGSVSGNWSATVNVVGAYYDEFDNPNSGWSMRRTTHLDHVNTWYEIHGDDDWLILEIGDKWDWGISSSMAKAPKPPYVIEYDGKFAQTPNEVAMGIVFGGDFPADECPMEDTVDGWYQHDDCFNHFYNPHYYWAGEALHLLFYRTDRLVWCPDCDGSPMKRLGDSVAVGQMSNVDNDDWNRHRIEVRNGSIKYYAGRPHDANLKLQFEYGDTRWINEPYFGIFAYAGEYTSSVARFENFRITPLDN